MLNTLQSVTAMKAGLVAILKALPEGSYITKINTDIFIINIYLIDRILYAILTVDYKLKYLVYYKMRWYCG